jgi:hypothetical protein
MNVTKAKRRMGVLIAVCGAVFWLACPVFAEALVGMGENPPRYEVVPWTNGWHAAKADAEARGGHLAVITSGEEWLALTRTFSPEELAGCWLGASDEETEGTWKWVTGEPMGYVRWAGVEPNNDRGNPEGQENYLVVDDRWGIIHWNDVYEQCSEATKYLLEREGETLLPRIPRKCGTAFLPSAAPMAVPAELREGLVAYWPLDGDAKDASGNGNDGVLHGAISAPDRNGKAGGALRFDGASTVEIPDSLSLRTVTNAFTVAAWVQVERLFTRYGPAWASILAKGRNDRQFALNLCFSTHDAEIGMSRHAFFARLPRMKEWTHVAVTFVEDGEAIAYVNGKAAGTCLNPRTLPPNHEPLFLGADPYGDAEYLIGALDDVAVWNRALSAEEVAKLCPDATPPRVRTACSNLLPIRVFAPAAAPAGLREGLVAYWPLDGDARDTSGNGNDGVLHGTVPTPDRNGKADGALWFDGRSTVRVADSASLRGVTNAFTVAAWVKYDKPCTIVDSWVSILSKGTEGRQFGLNFNLTAPAANNTEIGLFQHAAFRAFPEKGVWTHVAATFDANGRSTAYVNGKAVGTWSSPRLLSVNREELVIGADPHGDAEYLFGALDDVAVWNRALSADEVAKLAAGAESAAPANPPRYEIVPWTKGWQAAKADAEARGGHLATVTSAEEWETIRNLFPLRDLLGCWLGASDAEEEGVWRWVTGEPWGFARWAPDQPDAMREGQDFLWLHVNFAGHWDDIEGDDPGATKYLLEREGPPISVSGLRQPFRLSPHVLLVEAAGGTNEVEVLADGAWAAAERVPWISLKHAHGNGPGRLAVKVAANESPAKRSAKVRVRTTWDGEWRDIAVEQRGMEQVAMPRIRSRGGTFEGPKQRVVLSCATEGASIRYTLDGSDPDGTSPLYAGSFNLSATATVKARAFKDGMLPSGLAEASFARRTSLAEAIGMPEGIVSTDRFTGWRGEEGAGREGGPAAKSGAIGPEGRSRMEVRVEGAGTVAFWWKASCEDDLDGTGWDRVAFSVDGLEKAALDGESGWQRVEAEVKGEGVHVLAWEYAKDWIDEKPTADAAWVEGVSWRPATKRQARSKE